MKHTPEWKATEYAKTGFNNEKLYRISDREDETVMWVESSLNQPLAQRRSALIVTAVNSHATLLSALEELLGACLVVSPHSDDTLECTVCGFSCDEDFNEFEFHDESMPCGRAAAALKEARGEA